MVETDLSEIEQPSDNIRESNFYKAIRYYQKVLNSDPHNAEALYKIADLYYEKGEHTKAIEYYRRVLFLYSNDVSSIKKSYFYLETNDYGQELELAPINVSYETEVFSKFLNLAGIYSEKKDYWNAIRIYEDIIEKTEHDVRYSFFFERSLRKIVVLYDRIESYEKEFESYIKILTKFSKPHEVESFCEKIRQTYYNTLLREEKAKTNIILEGKRQQGDIYEKALSDKQQAINPLSRNPTHGANAYKEKEPNLPIELRNRITNLLKTLPNIDDFNMRRTLIYSAGLDLELQNQIEISNPPSQFAEILVNTLCRYGKLFDGRDPLQAILTAAKRYFGQEKQEYCEILMKEQYDFINAQKEITEANYT